MPEEYGLSLEQCDSIYKLASTFPITLVSKKSTTDPLNYIEFRGSRYESISYKLPEIAECILTSYLQNNSDNV